MASRPQTTVFVSGLGDSSNESTLLQYFAPFGEVMDVQLPKQRVGDVGQGGQESGDAAAMSMPPQAHRGFGFVVFATQDEAEDAIDNMNLNEVEGRIVNVSLARPSARNAGAGDARRAIWDDEEWIKEHGGGGGDETAAVLPPEADAAMANASS